MSRPRREWRCDRCGGQMKEYNCKISCPNCGYRFDCSDVTLNFDPLPEDESPRVSDTPSGRPARRR